MRIREVSGSVFRGDRYRVPEFVFGDGILGAVSVLCWRCLG